MKISHFEPTSRIQLLLTQLFSVYLDYNVTLLPPHEQHGLWEAVVVTSLVHQDPIITEGGARILKSETATVRHKQELMLNRKQETLSVSFPLSSEILTRLS